MQTVEWTLYTAIGRGASSVQWRSAQTFTTKAKLVEAIEALRGSFAAKSMRITKDPTDHHKYTVVGSTK